MKTPRFDYSKKPASDSDYLCIALDSLDGLVWMLEENRLLCTESNDYHSEDELLSNVRKAIDALEYIKL